MSDGIVSLYPAWKQAVEDFLDAGFQPGDVITHLWLAEHFGMPMLDDAATITPAEYRERQFTWLQHVEAVKSELLDKHQVFLKSVFGEGYRWVLPSQQTGVAISQFELEAKRAYKKAGRRLTNLRMTELTDAQRQENLDAIGRLSMLQGMHRELK